MANENGCIKEEFAQDERLKKMPVIITNRTVDIKQLIHLLQKVFENY
ncbi:MAG: hypothetical protein H0V66_07660 [Bdellovibrionales bacterium]|nr:hypothetical protein [Bdellovibrionales bacterium]